MKKAGIFTYHFTTNFGGVLQAYALRRKINSFDGVNAEIVNYIPPFWRKTVYSDPSLNKRYIEQFTKFDDFRKNEIGITTEPISNLKSNINYNYDYFITGSDQVWNSCDKDSAYFLNFVSGDKIKIAYAASIGRPAEYLTAAHDDTFRNVIPSFNYISLREKSHVNYISRFSDKRVEAVLDPTLLLRKTDYEEILINPACKDKYILLYFLSHDLTAPNILSFCNRVVCKSGLKVIHNFAELSANILRNETGSFKFAAPGEFLGLIKNAELVITNSFHGTVFSILFGKPFYSFIAKPTASRIYDLLNSLELNNRIIEGYKPLSDVSFNINYTEAYLKLDILRRSSEEFLRNALDIE